jgi:hypothetical protein
MTPGSAGRRRLHWLSWLLCGLSLLTSAASIGFPVLAVDLRDVRGVSSGVPDGISALAFPVALLLFLVLEIPVIAAGLGLWRAFLAVRRQAHAS